MIVVTLPDPQSKAPFVTAIKRLISDGRTVSKVVRVYSAGDELACEDGDGVPRETVLFLDGEGRPCTALLLPGGTLGVRPGWVA